MPPLPPRPYQTTTPLSPFASTPIHRPAAGVAMVLDWGTSPSAAGGHEHARPMTAQRAAVSAGLAETARQRRGLGIHSEGL